MKERLSVGFMFKQINNIYENIYPTEKAYDIQKKMDNYRKKIDRRLTIGMSKKEIAALEKMLDRVLYNISDP